MSSLQHLLPPELQKPDQQQRQQQQLLSSYEEEEEEDEDDDFNNIFIHKTEDELLEEMLKAKELYQQAKAQGKTLKLTKKGYTFVSPDLPVSSSSSKTKSAYSSTSELFGLDSALMSTDEILRNHQRAVTEFDQYNAQLAATYPDSQLPPELDQYEPGYRNRFKKPTFALLRDYHKRQIAEIKARYLGDENNNVPDSLSAALKDADEIGYANRLALADVSGTLNATHPISHNFTSETEPDWKTDPRSLVDPFPVYQHPVTGEVIYQPRQGYNRLPKFMHPDWYSKAPLWFKEQARDYEEEQMKLREINKDGNKPTVYPGTEQIVEKVDINIASEERKNAFKNRQELLQPYENKFYSKYLMYEIEKQKKDFRQAKLRQNKQLHHLQNLYNKEEQLLDEEQRQLRHLPMPTAQHTDFEFITPSIFNAHAVSLFQDVYSPQLAIGLDKKRSELVKLREAVEKLRKEERVKKGTEEDEILKTEEKRINMILNRLTNIKGTLTKLPFGSKRQKLEALRKLHWEDLQLVSNGLNNSLSRGQMDISSSRDLTSFKKPGTLQDFSPKDSIATALSTQSDSSSTSTPTTSLQPDPSNLHHYPQHQPLERIQSLFEDYSALLETSTVGTGRAPPTSPTQSRLTTSLSQPPPSKVNSLLDEKLKNLQTKREFLDQLAISESQRRLELIQSGLSEEEANRIIPIGVSMLPPSNYHDFYPNLNPDSPSFPPSQSAESINESTYRSYLSNQMESLLTDDERLALRDEVSGQFAANSEKYKIWLSDPSKMTKNQQQRLMQLLLTGEERETMLNSDVFRDLSDGARKKVLANTPAEIEKAYSLNDISKNHDDLLKRTTPSRFLDVDRNEVLSNDDLSINRSFLDNGYPVLDMDENGNLTTRLTDIHEYRKFLRWMIHRKSLTDETFRETYGSTTRSSEDLLVGDLILAKMVQNPLTRDDPFGIFPKRAIRQAKEYVVKQMQRTKEVKGMSTSDDILDNYRHLMKSSIDIVGRVQQLHQQRLASKTRIVDKDGKIVNQKPPDSKQSGPKSKLFKAIEDEQDAQRYEDLYVLEVRRVNRDITGTDDDLMSMEKLYANLTPKQRMILDEATGPLLTFTDAQTEVISRHMDKIKQERLMDHQAFRAIPVSQRELTIEIEEKTIRNFFDEKQKETIRRLLVHDIKYNEEVNKDIRSRLETILNLENAKRTHGLTIPEVMRKKYGFLKSDTDLSHSEHDPEGVADFGPVK